MSDVPLSGLQYFDPQQDHTVGWKRLPHWAQAGTVCFITWRTADSLPVVMNSLLHFDNDRYVLTDAVVMPNHVHLLVAFRDEDSLLTQCTSWKHFTATQINRWLWRNLSRGTTELRRSVVPRPRFQPPATGEFWQVEQFDHLVRSPEDFDKYRRYVADNPNKAHVPAGSYRYFTKVL